MVSDAQGELGEALHLINRATTRNSGRTIYLHRELRDALAALKAERKPDPADRIITSERGHAMTPGSIQNWFASLFKTLGFDGASSHSDRRTFITNCAKKIIQAGGSLRDVQELAGHSSLSLTPRYIQGDAEAKRRVISLI